MSSLPITTPLAFLYLAMAKEQNEALPLARVHLAYEDAL